jgi:hypothetical protein
MEDNIQILDFRDMQFHYLRSRSVHIHSVIARNIRPPEHKAAVNIDLAQDHKGKGRLSHLTVALVEICSMNCIHHSNR